MLPSEVISMMVCGSFWWFKEMIKTQTFTVGLDEFTAITRLSIGIWLTSVYELYSLNTLNPHILLLTEKYV